MRQLHVSVTALAAACLLLCAQEARGQVYQWTDESGELHFSDSMQTVPTKYRPKVRKDEAAAKQTAKGVGKKDGATKDDKASAGKPADTRLAFGGSAKGGSGSGGGYDNSASIRALVQALESEIRHLRGQIAPKERFMNLSSGSGSVYVGIPAEQRREMQAEIDHLNSRIAELERQIREAQSEAR
jgi:hypothetical protein